MTEQTVPAETPPQKDARQETVPQKTVRQETAAQESARHEREERGVEQPDDGWLVRTQKKHRRWRERLRHRRTANLVYRISTGVVGTLVLCLGILLIPYPGPGWAVVIAGLAILASEFSWAQRVLAQVKKFYYGWTRWLASQPRWIQALAWLGTAAIVLTTLWLIGALALMADLVGYDAGWVQSPL